MEKKRLNNEGFSLIELIIVIAIMAVLVGALAPQLIKYIERSRVSADMQVADSVKTAIETALTDPSLTKPTTLTATATDIKTAIAHDGAAGSFATEVEDLLGIANVSELEGKLKSDGHGAVQVAYDGKSVMVQLPGTTDAEGNTPITVGKVVAPAP